MNFDSIKLTLMNFKGLFFILIILMMISCKFFKLEKSSKSFDEEAMTFYPKFSHSDSSKIAYFECEDFVSNALNNYTIAKINQKFLKLLNCSKKSIVNKYDPAVIDTIYTFSNPENKIQIYRAKQNDFIFTFDVTDPKFKLTGNIKPGMKKDVFTRKFHITENINNKVQIVNSAGTMRFMFYFENNMLKRIYSYLYLD